MTTRQREPSGAAATPNEAEAFPAGSSLQERKRELVKDEIARVAWELFDREGYEATTVDEIAARAGMSRRTFFRYYASKEDVVVGTSDAIAEDFLAAFAARPLEEPAVVSIQRALRPMVEQRLADAEQGRAIIRLLRDSPTLRRAMLERHARMEERLAAMLAARMGRDLRSDPTPALLAFVARALMDTAFNVWYDQRPLDPGAMVDDLFRLLREAVALPQPAGTVGDAYGPDATPPAPGRTPAPSAGQAQAGKAGANRTRSSRKGAGGR